MGFWSDSVQLPAIRPATRERAVPADRAHPPESERPQRSSAATAAISSGSPGAGIQGSCSGSSS